MHFTSSDDYLYRSNGQLNQSNDASIKMQQQQDIKPSQSPSSSSNHTVSNLINNDQSNQTQLNHQSYLNTALLEVMSTLNTPTFNSVLNQLNENQKSYPFDFQKYFLQPQFQEKDDKLKTDSNLPLSSSLSVTSSSSSSSNISSPNNTPCKKRALSDVISKLRNQQTNNDDDSANKNGSNNGDLEADNNESDSTHNNCSNNDYSASVGDETDYANDDANENDEDDDIDNDDEEDEDREDGNRSKKRLKKNKSKVKNSTNKTNCSSSSSSSSGIDMISNASSNSNLMINNNDYHLSAAEQISALINNVVVNTHNLTSSPSPQSPIQQQQVQSKLLNQQINNEQNIAKASINRINNLIMSSDSSVKKSQMDLLKLLERANLTQYMQVFIEQGGDDINQLVEADEEEFKEIIQLVGMTSKPLHVKRLRKTIDEYKSSNGKILNELFNYFQIT